MRIAVASDDGEHVATHTGRCRGILIFDIDGETVRAVEERPNTFTAHALGECDGTAPVHRGEHHSHDGLTAALSDCQVLITRALGPRLVRDLNARGIEPYVCSVDRAGDAARLFAKGLLPRVAGTGCGHHS